MLIHTLFNVIIESIFICNKARALFPFFNIARKKNRVTVLVLFFFFFILSNYITIYYINFADSSHADARLKSSNQIKVKRIYIAHVEFSR